MPHNGWTNEEASSLIVDGWREGLEQLTERELGKLYSSLKDALTGLDKLPRPLANPPAEQVRTALESDIREAAGAVRVIHLYKRSLRLG